MPKAKRNLTKMKRVRLKDAAVILGIPDRVLKSMIRRSVFSTQRDTCHNNGPQFLMIDELELYQATLAAGTPDRAEAAVIAFRTEGRRIVRYGWPGWRFWWLH
jgi:hypothetical protein